MRQTWTCAVDRDFLQPACWWCWVKFDLIVGAESKRKKETRRGKTYGRMNGVCAYRDNLHSHQLLGLRTLLSFLYPCSGFPGSTFARNVIVAKFSRGSAVRSRHRRCRAARLTCVSNSRWKHIELSSQRCWEITFQPPAVALHWIHFDVVCDSRETFEAFSVLVVCLTCRMGSQNVHAGHQSYRNMDSDTYVTMAAVLSACGCNGS